MSPTSNKAHVVGTKYLLLVTKLPVVLLVGTGPLKYRSETNELNEKKWWQVNDLNWGPKASYPPKPWVIKIQPKRKKNSGLAIESTGIAWYHFLKKSIGIIKIVDCMV